MAPRKITPFAERFARYMQPGDPACCWLWTGAIRSGGYGVIHAEGNRLIGAHRAAWILTHGPVPEGLFVLHRCDVRICVNPAHLFLGTKADNTQDMIAKGRDRLIGEHNYWTRLTDADVRAIVASSDYARIEAARYGVAITTIWHIRQRHKRRHVVDVTPAADYPRDALLGARNHQTVLTEAQVREIRQSPETGRALAKRFGVTFQTISMVRRRKNWKHIP